MTVGPDWSVRACGIRLQQAKELTINVVSFHRICLFYVDAPTSES